MQKKLFVFGLILLQLTSLPAAINQVCVTVTGICCEYCTQEIEKNFRQLHGLNDVRVFPHPGLVEVDWNPDFPLHAAILLQPFNNTRFTAAEIDIDLEGTFSSSNTSPHIKSEPDGAIFFIDNMNSAPMQRLREGDVVRLRGYLTNRQGFNFVVVRQIMSINEQLSS